MILYNFFFIYFSFKNMTFSNVFLALIIDAFGVMREKDWINENDKNNVCL